jgi:hypothetical protein
MEVTVGTRSESIKATAEVFPHGPCDVKGKFARLARALGLQPFNGEGSLNPGATVKDEILSINPWSEDLLRARYGAGTIKMPAGYDKKGYITAGRTEVWVEYWCLPPLKKFTGFLDVSCLTWHYEQVEDCETSLVIGVHGLAFSPMNEQYENVARQLAAQMAEFLKGAPPSAESGQKRATR